MRQLTLLLTALLCAAGTWAAPRFGLHGSADSCVIIGAVFQARAQGRGQWGIAWDSDSMAVTVTVVPATRAKTDDFYPAPTAILVSRAWPDSTVRGQAAAQLLRMELDADGDAWRGCTLKVIYDQPSDTLARLYAGVRDLEYVGLVPFCAPRRFTSFNGPGDNTLTRAELYLDTVPPIGRVLLPLPQPRSAGTPEGEWEFMDRDIIAHRTTIGGAYRLAVTTAAAGEYDIVLLEGAEINRRLWPAGAVKGTLRATLFAGDFDLTWRDASGRVLTGEMNATLEGGGQLLTLRFPLHGATLRFRRRI